MRMPGAEIVNAAYAIAKNPVDFQGRETLINQPQPGLIQSVIWEAPGADIVNAANGTAIISVDVRRSLWKKLTNYNKH